MRTIDVIQVISLVGVCALLYLILQDFNSSYAKGFVYVLITFFFMVALELLAGIIAEISIVFMQFDVGEMYVSNIVKLIGIIYYAEFIGFILSEAKLGSISKIVEYIVKLNLIAYSIPLIVTLLELILSIF